MVEIKLIHAAANNFWSNRRKVKERPEIIKSELSGMEIALTPLQMKNSAPLLWPMILSMLKWSRNLPEIF